MSITTPPRKTASDGGAGDEECGDDYVHELHGRHYEWLGQDTEGWHHHYDEDEETVYVTDERAEAFEHPDYFPYWYRIVGTVDHVEHLSEHAEKDVDDWVQYVEYKRGWRSRPVNISVALEALHEPLKATNEGRD